MKRASLFVLLLAALTIFAAQTSRADEAKPDVVATDKQKLQGRWTTTHMGSGGFPLHAVKTKQGKNPVGVPDFIFEGDRLTIVYSGEKGGPDRTPYRIDPTKAPTHIDVMTVDGKEPWALGIYKIDGDTLTFCWEDEKNRPTGFKIAEERKNARLFILVRQPPKK